MKQTRQHHRRGRSGTTEENVLNILIPFLVLLALPKPGHRTSAVRERPPSLIVLGNTQDGGWPQAGCAKACCTEGWKSDATRRFVACLGLSDPESHQRWMFDATPDFRDQLRTFDEWRPAEKLTYGVFLTHAHVGHYTGLIALGREVIGASNIPVYAMPRMEAFLRTNGPWNQLVALKNIVLRSLAADSIVQLNARLRVQPILVPHRDEFSETVGFIIEGPHKRALYIPDIDKWERWDRNIDSLIRTVEYAFLDGTFYRDGEIVGRSMKDIPHPFVEESERRFEQFSAAERNIIYFIHLNHTNPALKPQSAERKEIEAKGMHVAERGDQFEL